MNWYLAKMVFRIICGEGEHTPQFDEQLRLVAGNSKEEAFRKAQEMGQQEEEAFYNRKEQLVQWQFINISELYRLSELIDGAELYSRIEEKDNAEAISILLIRKQKILFATKPTNYYNLPDRANASITVFSKTLFNHFQYCLACAYGRSCHPALLV